MSHTDGWIIAAIAFAFTATVIGIAGAAIAWTQIQEERYGTGRRRKGCRRDAGRTGCARRCSRPEDPARDAIRAEFHKTGWIDSDTIRRLGR